MRQKFVYSTAGKVYIIRPGGYHHDCGLRSDNVAYAGWFDYDSNSDKISLFGSSLGYDIDIGPEENHPTIEKAILTQLKGERNA